VKVKPCCDVRPTENRTVISFIIVGLFLLPGCNGKTTWSAEAQSPDGKMIATARTVENSGFGTGGVFTAVYLNWTTGKQQPREVLEIGDGPGGPGDTVVTMKWISPTHLELAYNVKRGPLGFQAVKWAGVDISVRDLSSETIK
jgi:hypothetical protein